MPDTCSHCRGANAGRSAAWLSRPREDAQAAQQLQRRSDRPNACAPGCAAGKWTSYPANLGMGLATFDIMAQLLAHPLTDAAHVWTTRWKTNSPPTPYTGAYNTDALLARPPPHCPAAAAQQAALPEHRAPAPRSPPQTKPLFWQPTGCWAATMACCAAGHELAESSLAVIASAAHTTMLPRAVAPPGGGTGQARA